jgi:hypothetical protein
MIYPYEIEDGTEYTLEVFADASPLVSSVNPIDPYWMNAEMIPFEITTTATDPALVEGEVPSGEALFFNPRPN